MFKHLLCSLFLLATYYSSNGQESIYYARTIDNLGISNPSYNSLSRDWRVDLLLRDQWSGLEGAPVSSSMHLRGGLKNHQLGFGLVTNVESIGLRTNSLVISQVHSGIRLGSSKHLYFGINMGLNMGRYDLSDSNFDSGTTPVGENTNDLFSGFGISYHHKNIIIGGSFNYGIQNSDIENYHITSLHLEYTHQINSNWCYQPGLLVNIQSGSDPIYDIKTGLTYKNRFGLDFIYRNQDGLSSVFSVNIKERLKIAYAYQMMIGETADLANSSNEIGIHYVIKEITPVYKTKKSSHSKPKKNVPKVREEKDPTRNEIRQEEVKTRMDEHSDRMKEKMDNDAIKLHEKMKKEAAKVREKMKKDAEKARERMEKVRQNLKTFIREFEY